MNLKSKMQSLKDHSNFKINISIKDNGKMIKEMEKVFKYGKMDPSTKDTGKIILPMDMADSYMPTEMSTLEAGSMIEPQEKV